MLRFILYLLILIVAGALVYVTFLKTNYASDEATLTNGKVLFTKYCSSCHSLEADGFGPPLGGITSVLSKDALVGFIQNPSKVIASKKKGL
jgi:mono/diheme cytochrome c family protein